MIFFRNYFLPTLVKLGPPRFRRFLVDLLPLTNVRRLRDIVDVMHNTSIEILEAKRRALKEGDEALARQIGRGKDIISVLSMRILTSCCRPADRSIWSVRANMEASKEDKLSDSEVLGQVISLPGSGTRILLRYPYRCRVYSLRSTGVLLNAHLFSSGL
jgi:hypothetical protein